MTFDITLLYVLAVLVFSGGVKGVIGMGLPAISMGLLAVVMPRSTAATILLPALILTNVTQMLTGPHFGALLRRLWPFLLGVTLGTVAGTGWLSGEYARIGGTILGATLAIYGITGLLDLDLRFSPGQERWLGPLLGLIAGLINAATAVFSVPAVPFLRGIGLDKDELIQALGLSFTVSSLALGINLGLSSGFDPALAGLSLTALAAAGLGMVVGQRIRGRMDAATFRRCFFIGLVVLGSYLTLRGLL